MRHLIVFAALLAPLAFLNVAGATTSPANSGEGPHVRVQLVADHLAVQPGDRLQVGVVFTLDAGWHLYWRNPGDAGLAPRVRWQLPAGWSVDAPTWPVPRRLLTASLATYVYDEQLVLSHPVAISTAVAVGAAQLQAEVRWLVCAEICIPGAATLAVAVDVAPSRSSDPAGVAALSLPASSLPGPLPGGWQVRASAIRGRLALQVEGAPLPKMAAFFPQDPMTIEHAAAQLLRAAPHGFRLDLVPAEVATTLPGRLQGLLVLEPESAVAAAYEVDVAVAGREPGAAEDVRQASGSAPAPAPLAAADGPASGPLAPAALLSSPPSSSRTGGAPLELVAAYPPAAQSTAGLFGMLLLAFAGGILLNLMPCVFPVLSLKVVSFLQAAGPQRTQQRQHAWAYTLGVLLAFWLLTGVLLVLRGVGHQVGWGFQLQAPGFVLVLVLVFFLLGLLLLGASEVGASLMGLGQSYGRRGGLLGALATGLLATVVATPCTAPLMGAAVGYALSQPAATCLAVFTALGLGLALPVLGLAYLPQAGRLLPRPGPWMEALKEAMAFPLFATAIWLLSVLVQQAGLGALVAALRGLWLVGLAAWLLHRWPQRRAFSWVAYALLVLAVAVGLHGVQGAAGSAATGDVGPHGAAGGSVTSRDAHGLVWSPFSDAAVAQARAAGHPVLVDFTAAWCLTCSLNEANVFGSAAVRAALQARQVVLLRADWTREDVAITAALARHGRSGVPLLVLHPANPAAPAVVLPELLSAGQVLHRLAALP